MQIEGIEAYWLVTSDGGILVNDTIAQTVYLNETTKVYLNN